MQDCFTLANAHLPQFRDPSSRVPPLLPVTAPDAPTDPLIKLAENASDRHEAEVARPSLEISAKFLGAASYGHAAFATRNLAYAVLELLIFFGLMRI